MNIVINEEAETLRENLGVSDEVVVNAGKKIAPTMTGHFLKGEPITNMMRAIADSASNENELLFLAFNAGTTFAAGEQRLQENPMFALMQQLGNRKNQDNG